MVVKETITKAGPLKALTMKAAQIEGYGGNEVLKIVGDRPVPVIKGGHLLIETRAAGVNPADWKMRQGLFQKNMLLPFPITLGGDFSGVVAEVGEDIKDFRPGDRVYGMAHVLTGGSGAFAEYVLAKAGSVYFMPADLGFAEAASLPLVGASAIQALIDTMEVYRGQQVLIHGGAGGIGSVAVQIAHHLGAYVAATAGKNDLRHVQQLGADKVIDYGSQAFMDLLFDYDAVLDTVGGETYRKSFRVLKKGGVIVSMIEAPNPELMARYGVTAYSQFTKVTRERLMKLNELVDMGVVKPQVGRVFPLDQAARALAYLQEGHHRGKVLLKIKG